MPELTHLPATTSPDSILERLDGDGAVIVDDLLPGEMVERILDELMPFIRGTVPFENEFAGLQTTRTGALVPRSAGVRDLLVEPKLLEVAKTFLEPYCDRIQLNLSQVIRLLPGQKAQELHRDRFIWGRYLPREVETHMSTITALTDFTAENGATVVVPGSHRWDWDRIPDAGETARATMGRGSVLFFTGSVIHGGGRNASAADRIALNLAYTLGWLRQEENQYLSCPPHLAQTYPVEVQELLGYTQGNVALGYYSPEAFRPDEPDLLPPEFAVGRQEAFAEPDTF